jgi:hypothetical protein
MRRRDFTAEGAEDAEKRTAERKYRGTEGGLSSSYLSSSSRCLLLCGLCVLRGENSSSYSM